MTSFGLRTLPYGSFSTAQDPRPRVGVAVANQVLDVSAASAQLLPAYAEVFASGTLDALLAGGPDVWATVRSAVESWVHDARARAVLHAHFHAADAVRMLAPFTVADYVDFYASEPHATAVGRIFRPDGDALTPNWKHLPIGYHGRAGTVVPSGTPIVRPRGQRRTPEGEVVFGPSTRLDIEAEVGFVVGTPSTLGEPVGLDDFDQHVFGIVLVNDWSARDLQAWEYVPLGPFLGKSFATSISPWVVPLAALEHARVAPPVRDVPLLPYLEDGGMPPWGLDLQLQVRLNGEVISEPPYAGMYWTPAQMLAHLSVNGASIRSGDLYASGTVSGPRQKQAGSMLELSNGGREPFPLQDGTTRSFLQDGDEVVISATAPGAEGTRISLGEVRGVVHPSRPST
ncbi:fumarylacetoacetase [Allobranchiibius huperziae]|uniref:fumarylacetoacetase n=1 Tax=Allobranchiibius huperziae TaxID=1874116 RepID=A0A853DAW1_9MICO|nr:fumarylacetoacetase [Allobranchiibius huperziae]NYJ73093.1 fumarylacetoacetase [Allobranchiibius huperziae]